ncbi:ABC transporter permease [Falsiroseomonas tokyonensis]|uniref:ABC transporter permease n=1 Tax=Falsiroseomonas tokyonensis TaxID=430521 RepID=A0ABV7BRU0_9PROT|nr:ABC transporter permease [Falsiroseomonas tokyonensis]MBU8538260.1 ABC transporter permease [Falsiroseomonas tokyonensis]
MAAGQDARRPLAAIGAAIEAGLPEQAAGMFEAWAHPDPAAALLALLLLDRRDALAEWLPRAETAGLEAALRELGLPVGGPGPDLVAALLGLARDPGAETARVHFASLVLVAGRHRLAEALLLPAWAGHASSAMVARALSGTWMLLGREAQALEAARIAAEAAPQAPEPMEHLAGLLLRAGQPGPALLAAGRAIGAAPQSHQGWRLASTGLLELGQTADAIAAANRAARLSALHAPHAEQIRTAHAAELPAAHAAELPAAGAAELPGDSAAPSPQRPKVQADWARLPTAAVAPPPPPLRRAVATRARIVDALLLRETRTMFSGSRLGYAWALVEPLSHVLLLSAVFFFLGHDSRPPIGDAMLTFYMTGVLSFLFFAHMTERAMDLPAANRSLLLVPAVGLFDILAAKAVLSAVTDLVVAAVTFALLIALGVGKLPEDPAAMVACYLMLFLLSFGVACVNMVASTVTSAWEKLWPSFLRLQYFTCGVFYHPLDMPEDIRNLILLNPLVHVTEWMRQAYFHGYESPFLDIPYLFQWTIGCLLVGTALFAAAARQMRRPA